MLDGGGKPEWRLIQSQGGPHGTLSPSPSNGSQPHFTQTGRRPILRRRAAAAFYVNGSQTHFTQTGHSPILREDRHRHELGELALVGLRRCCGGRSSVND